MNDPILKMLDICGEIQIAPKGISMRPYLWEKRDKVFIVPCKSKLKKYDIVLYKNGGVYILHRIIGETDKEYIICGDNSGVKEIIPKDRIIGVVSAIQRKNRKIVHPDGSLGRIWTKIWYDINVKRCAMKVKIIYRKLFGKKNEIVR